MNITMHTRGKPHAFIRELVGNVKKSVAPRGKYVVISGSPLADPELFAPIPTRFLAAFYAWTSAHPVRTAVELGCLDKVFLPDVPGTTSLAVDQRDDGLRLVKRRFPHVAPLRAKIRTLPLADESCDLVFWNKEMLHFLGEYADEAEPYATELLTGVKETAVDRALRDIYRIIKPGGYFVENYPMRDTWGLPLRFKKIKAVFSDLHYVLTSEQNLAAMFFRK